MIRLPGGKKMSSRKGNNPMAQDILDAAVAANKAATGSDDYDVVLAAVKYAFLKYRIGGDMVYNPEESVSLEGDSGPYLQYAHARARSILKKAGEAPGEPADDLDQAERTLARKISEYPDTVAKATDELMPHHIAGYLYELAQTFNRFYEKSRVIGDPRQATRQQLVALYADVLKDGLQLLHIAAPEHL
jgi:arginyl-tRNA synthetase